MLTRFSLALLALGATIVSTFAQSIVIDGVVDRTKYDNQATFRVQTNVGFTYAVTLNNVSVPAGISNTVMKMDYYDLRVTRTDTNTLAVTNALVRFIVQSTQRGDPERGLIQWVPLPPIPSTTAEISGGPELFYGGPGLPMLHVMTPSSYPAGLEIPVIVRVDNTANGSPEAYTGTRRVNGWVANGVDEGGGFLLFNPQAPIRLLRGVGHGFLPPATTNQGVLNWVATVGTLYTSAVVSVETTTTWTTVSGVLGAATTWPANSRIAVTGHLTVPAGGTLTIGEGTVVRLNPGVNITNSGSTVINGDTVHPVVFTATNRVAPEQRAGAWGGWIMRGGELVANATIMTGSGAAASLSYSPGSSHRSEQPLLFVHNSVVRMTNCALVTLAGQVGNGYRSSIVWDRCLIQRAITCGEYDGGTNIIKDSALIEFPSVDGVYSAAIADADYDGFYTINSTNYFVNSLFGFAKDDAIDSGSGGPGSLVVSNCWVESALHEALAWSGEGRRTWTYHSVLMNSGQGIECGWSTTNATSLVSPICYAKDLFSTANSVGARFGDNYTGTSGLGNKAGFLTITNSFILHNYRDVWGQVWDNTWNYRSNQMDIRSNFITQANSYHPSNTLWNPATDAARLAPFMSTPPSAPVGVGLALWNLQITAADLTNGIPVRLSSFTTNTVTVNYTIATPSSSLATGTLTFTPGETVKKIFANPSVLAGATTWRVALANPSGGEITGASAAYALAQQPTNAPSALIGAGTAWRYLDDGSDQGTAWRSNSFVMSAFWSNGPAQLGFGDGDEITRTRRTNNTTAGNSITTFYFRRAFTVSNPSAYANLSMWMLRDDGGVVYVNGAEVFRSPSLAPAPAPILFNTFASQQGSAPSDNTIDTATLSASLLLPGTNWVTVEIHQFDLPSSDLSFDFSLTGNSAPQVLAQPFGGDLLLNWNAPDYLLEQANEVTGPWTPVPSFDVPATVNPNAAKKFFRLRK